MLQTCHPHLAVLMALHCVAAAGLAALQKRYGGVPACFLKDGSTLQKHDPGNFHELLESRAALAAKVYKGQRLEAELGEIAAHIRFLQVTAQRKPGFASLLEQPRAELVGALRHAAALHAAHVRSSRCLLSAWPYAGSEACWEPLFEQISPQQQLWLMADILATLAAREW